jgi:hypothetical protein
VVVDAQDRIAAVGLAETVEGLRAVERIDENWNEARGGGDDAWIAERTAREVLAAGSPRVLAEVHPERLVLLAGDPDGVAVVDVPEDPADAHALGRGRCSLC